MQEENKPKNMNGMYVTIMKARKCHHGNPQKAIELYKQVAAVGEPDFSIFNDIADAYNLLGDFGKALEYGKKALEKKPDDPWTLDTVATTYAGLEEDEAAETYYQKAIDLKSDYTIAYMNLAGFYAANDQLPKAEETLHKAIRNCDDKENLNTLLGDIYSQANKSLKALEAFTESLNTRKKNRSPILVRMAKCYGEKLNEHDNAIRCLQEALNERYNNPEAHYLLSKSLNQKGMEAEQKKLGKRANNLYRRSVQELGLAIAYEKDYDGHKHIVKILSRHMGLGRDTDEEEADKISRYIR